MRSAGAEVREEYAAATGKIHPISRSQKTTPEVARAWT